METWLEKSEDFNSLKDKFELSGKALASLSKGDVQQASGDIAKGSALYNAIQQLKKGNLRMNECESN